MIKLKTLAANLGLIFGSLVFGVIVGEVGLRMAKIEYPLPPDPEAPSNPPSLFVLNDPYRGWAQNPNASAVWRGEGEVSEIKINSGGFRDREYTPQKPNNTFRVALLGDSFMEAMQLPLEKISQAIMEEELKKCAALKGRNVEVLNFGVQGYGTAQELMTLRHKVWDYSPDAVILVFYAGNDVRNNYRPLEYDHLRPYFIYQNGKLVEDLSFRQLSPKARDRYSFSWVDFLPRWLSENSRILQLIRHTEIESKKRQYIKDYDLINVSFYKEPPDENWREAWKITEGLMVLMRDEVVQKGADFMIVTASDSFQVNPDKKAQEDFMKHYNIKDLFYPDQRIQALGKREGITVLSLATPLKAVAEKTGKCLHGFPNAIPCGGHWNEEGNRLAGQLMANQVCQRLTQQQPQPKK